jgi:ribonuclease HI
MSKIYKFIILSILIIIIYLIVFSISTKEKFTSDDIKNYKQTFNINCIKNSKLYKKLKKKNDKKCSVNNSKGPTEKDTINNRRACYDDIAKEIVTKMDSESYCNMLDNKIDLDSNIKGYSKYDNYEFI